MRLHVVLHEPEIPQNTGNIARTCAAAGVSLHLIRPLGFSLDEKQVRRAGLDYWDKVSVRDYESIEAFFSEHAAGSCYFFTTKAKNRYDAVNYLKRQHVCEDVFLLFGKESAGLPEELLSEHREACVRIPMQEQARSLNLSNAAAVAVYEVLRQNSFESLKTSGELHRLSWR